MPELGELVVHEHLPQVQTEEETFLLMDRPFWLRSVPD